MHCICGLHVKRVVITQNHRLDAFFACCNISAKNGKRTLTTPNNVIYYRRMKWNLARFWKFKLDRCSIIREIRQNGKNKNLFKRSAYDLFLHAVNLLIHTHSDISWIRTDTKILPRNVFYASFFSKFMIKQNYKRVQTNVSFQNSKTAAIRSNNEQILIIAYFIKSQQLDKIRFEINTIQMQCSYAAANSEKRSRKQMITIIIDKVINWHRCTTQNHYLRVLIS